MVLIGMTKIMELKFANINRRKIAFILQICFIITTPLIPNYNDGASMEGTFLFICFALIILYIVLGICLLINLLINRVNLKFIIFTLTILKYAIPFLLTYLTIVLLNDNWIVNDYHAFSLLWLLSIMFII